jgi:hypothetical protein
MRERFHDHLILRFFIGKKSESPFEFSWGIISGNYPRKKSKKDPEFPGIIALQSDPARLLAVDIAGPLLNDPFRRFTPVTSPGLPG